MQKSKDMAQLIINYDSKNNIQTEYIKSLLGVLDYSKLGLVDCTYL